MNLRRFDLNLLPMLDALLAERNVTRAGERLLLSQSAMSGTLVKLRALYDDPLLVREGRNFVLTARAKELSRELRALLPQLDKLATPDPVFEPATARHTFTLQLSDYATMVLLPEVVRRIRATAPLVSIDVLPPQNKRQRGVIIEQLHDLVITPAEYAAADHPMEPLLADRWVCVVSADMEKYADGITLEDYLAARHVTVRFGNGRLPVIEEWHLQKSGLSRDAMLRLPYLIPPGAMIEGSDLILVTQRRLALMWAKIAKVRILPPPYEIPDQVLHMQWHAREKDNVALAWLREVFHEAARAIGVHPEDQRDGEAAEI